MKVDPMIRMIVGRCHVCESNVAVIKYLKSRTRKGSWWKIPKPMRREAMKQAIYCHRENFILYAAVQSGKF